MGIWPYWTSFSLRTLLITVPLQEWRLTGEGYKQFFAMTHSAFPDFHSTLEDMFAEGDKVVQRFTARGTHKGEFMGIPPTGKQVTITGIAIHRITGGKIVEDWVNMDMLGMMVQLGVVPPPG